MASTSRHPCYEEAKQLCQQLAAHFSSGFWPVNTVVAVHALMRLVLEFPKDLWALQLANKLEGGAFAVIEDMKEGPDYLTALLELRHKGHGHCTCLKQMRSSMAAYVAGRNVVTSWLAYRGPSPPSKCGLGAVLKNLLSNLDRLLELEALAPLCRAIVSQADACRSSYATPDAMEVLVHMATLPCINTDAFGLDADVELNRSLQQTSFHKLPLRFTMPHGLRGTPQAQVMLWKHLISPSCC